MHFLTLAGNGAGKGKKEERTVVKKQNKTKTCIDADLLFSKEAVGNFLDILNVTLHDHKSNPSKMLSTG